MELIKWGRLEGVTLIINREEAEDLLEVIKNAIRYGKQEGTYFNIEIEREYVPNEVK